MLEALAEAAPLVVVLEDLHDGDAATIEVLEALDASDRKVPLLCVVTYRPAEAILAGYGLHAMATRLAARGRSRCIDVDLLSAEEVRAYLTARDPGGVWNEERCATVHRHSGGNALFMAAIADTVEASTQDAGELEIDLPSGLRGVLEMQLRLLEHRDREILTAASAAGVEFSSLHVAAATGLAIDEIERICDALAQRQTWLRTSGISDWPSGDLGQTYRFRHELFRKFLYDSLPAARRSRLHQRIGEAVEAAYSGATVEVAAELADDFARSGDVGRAVNYLREAANVARARFAHRESLALLDAAFAMLARQPEGEERDPWEFRLQVDRAAAASSLFGHGSPPARAASERAEALARRLDASLERYLGLLVLFKCRIIRGEVAGATRLAQQMEAMAEQLGNPVLTFGSISCLAMADTTRGDLHAARERFEACVPMLPPEFRLPSFRDVLVPTLTGMAQNYCYLGERELARRASDDAIARADWLDDPFERACARVYEGYCAALFRDRPRAVALATAGRDIAREYAIEEMEAIGDIIAAWAARDDDAHIRRRRMVAGIGGLRRTGHLLGFPFYSSLLAEVELEAGDVESAAAVLAEARAFAEASGDRRHLAEVLRMSALAAERLGAHPETAAKWVAEARRRARRQGARLLLARLDDPPLRRG